MNMNTRIFVGTQLVAASLLFSAAGNAASQSAGWQLEALGNGLPEFVFSVAVMSTDAGPRYVAGGNFLQIGNLNVGSITVWSGSEWATLDRGFNGDVQMLAVTGPERRSLIAGGRFNAAIGGPRAERLAQFVEGSWTGFGTGLGACSNYHSNLGWCGINSRPKAIIVGEPTSVDIYAGGIFNRGTESPRGLARLNGSSWEFLPGDNSSSITGLVVFDNGSGSAMYAIGGFASDSTATGSRLRRWNGSGWDLIANPTTVAFEAITVHDDGTGPAIYVCARRSGPGGTILRSIERWNGTSWQQIGETFNGAISVLASSTTTSLTATPLLIAAGNFTQIGSTPVNRLALWNGSEWTQLADVDGTIRSISLDASGPRPLLLIGGDFLTVNGVTVNRIALLKGPSIADLNNDGFVNAADLGVLLGSWGNPGCAGGIPCPADLNNDGQVNATDLGILLGNWG